ncbi:MAG: tetratricopeptide repeat protein [Acidobacteria bacterium]|nr:MAG: tetratricopeptide repeat protein [Acidobacteriota bacterium]
MLRAVGERDHDEQRRLGEAAQVLEFVGRFLHCYVLRNTTSYVVASRKFYDGGRMSGWRRRLLPLLIVLPALVAYRNSFDGVFVFDDRPSIVDNPSVHNAAPWAHPWKAMQAPRNITLSGRPVASFTFALNYALAPANVRDVFDPPPPGSLASPLPFQRNAWGYHATNLAIHLIATLLLFGVVNRTLKSPIVAGATAIIWSVHPLTTGAVTYIVQRVESLMALFLLLTLYCAIRAWESKRWMIPAVLACALGMGSKEAMVGAPLIVVAWDWVFTRGTMAEQYRERWLLYLGLAATWLVLAALVAMDPRPLSSGFHFPDWPWPTYFLTQCGVIVQYLRLAIWPTPLVLDYDVRAVTAFTQVALQFLFLTALFVVSCWGFARRHALGFAGLGFFILLAPTSSVLPIVTEIAAEHRMYLPLALIVAAALASLSTWLARKRPRDRGWFIFGNVTAAILIVSALATDRRNAVYATDAGIWFDTVQKQPHNARARNNYASDLLKSGQPRAAEEHLRVAVAESPKFAEAEANLGVALATQGKAIEALPHFERALEINPFYTAAYENIAEAYGFQKQLAKAVKYFIKALDQRPDDVALLNKAAWILATAVDPAARDGNQAIVYAEHAVTLTERRDASSLDTLAAAYAEAGRFDEAIATGAAALELAQSRGDQAFPAELAARLALYRAHKPVRM